MAEICLTVQETSWFYQVENVFSRRNERWFKVKMYIAEAENLDGHTTLISVSDPSID